MEFRGLFDGIEEQVELYDGSYQVPINFDNGATTPPFKYVNEVIRKSIDMYGAIHRAGQKAEYSTMQYDNSKEKILDFLGVSSKDEYVVIYVKNTTEGINMLANELSEGRKIKVLSTRLEHHANDLPWRRVADTFYIDVDETGELDLNEVEEQLKYSQGTMEYVTVTGASNVTGYMPDIHKIARIVHRYGAKLIVDAAQLVAHRRINLKGREDGEFIDFIIFSGHKMYAPFGTGVIVGQKKAFEEKCPYISGGGAVRAVLDNDVFYKKTPDKEEAGTPNFLGVMAVSGAVTMLEEVGFQNIRYHEKQLMHQLVCGLKGLNRVVTYGNMKLDERLAVMSFNIKGISHDKVGAMLAKYEGIAVRNGCFCAQPYVMRLLGLSNKQRYEYLMHPEWPQPGMVRVSLGLYNTQKEVERFLEVIELICNQVPEIDNNIY